MQIRNQEDQRRRHVQPMVQRAGKTRKRNAHLQWRMEPLRPDSHDAQPARPQGKERLRDTHLS